MNPVGNVFLVIDELEDRLICSQRFFVNQDRQAIAVVPDNQVI
jgi:hypothetical protein